MNKKLEVTMTTEQTSPVSLARLTEEQQKYLEAIEWIIDPGNYTQRLFLTTIAHLRKVCRTGETKIGGSQSWASATQRLLRYLLKRRGVEALLSVQPHPGHVHVGWSKRLEDFSGEEKYRLGQLREELLLRPFETISREEVERVVEELLPKLQKPEIGASPRREETSPPASEAVALVDASPPDRRFTPRNVSRNVPSGRYPR